jgi:hypothetical protein
MAQPQDDKLNELYRQYGEIVIKLEYFQARLTELRNKIAQALAERDKK